MGWCRRAPLAALPLLAAVLLAGCGGGSSGRSVQSSPPTPASVVRTASSAPPVKPTASATPKATASATPKATASATPKATASATPKATASPSPAALPVAPDAGALPQTSAFPSTSSVAFRDAMTDLWLAVTADNARFALPAFFPEAAYTQLKAIAYPEADWQYRLWYDFALDVRAAHGLLAPGARLVRVIVPADEAAWVYPGACYNSIGYWHVGGARVVYTEHGQERSFGIASLISWRGVWYVVHFGEVLRPVVTGVVDEPAVGPGIPGPPGGC
jgi:hypothetical protein